MPRVALFHPRRAEHTHLGVRHVETSVDAERLVDLVAFRLGIRGVNVRQRLIGSETRNVRRQIREAARATGASLVFVSGRDGGSLRRLSARWARRQLPVPLVLVP